MEEIEEKLKNLLMYMKGEKADLKLNIKNLRL